MDSRLAPFARLLHPGRQGRHGFGQRSFAPFPHPGGIDERVDVPSTSCSDVGTSAACSSSRKRDAFVTKDVETGDRNVRRRVSVGSPSSGEARGSVRSKDWADSARWPVHLLLGEEVAVGEQSVRSVLVLTSVTGRRATGSQEARSRRPGSRRRQRR